MRNHLVFLTWSEASPSGLTYIMLVDMFPMPVTSKRKKQIIPETVEWKCPQTKKDAGVGRAW